MQSIANNRQRDRWIELNAINSISLDLRYSFWLLLFSSSFSSLFFFTFSIWCSTYQKGKWKHQNTRERFKQQHHDYRDLMKCAQRYTFKLSFRYQAKHQMILSVSNAKFTKALSYIFRFFVMMLDRVYRHNKNQEFTHGTRSEKQQYLIYGGNVLAAWNSIKSTESRIWCCVRYALRKKNGV